MKLFPSLVALSLSVLVVACGDGGTEADDGDDSDDSDSSDSSDTDPGPDADPSARCVPPTLPALAAIPDDPVLVPDDSDTIVAFEVQDDAIVGKFVADPAAGEAALKLWQELVVRIPTNQRLDLVEFHVFSGDDLAGFISGTTQSPTGRYGYTMSITSEYLDADRDPCAPLVPRRGNYGWTMIHEYGHMRSVIDGTLDIFTVPEQNGFGEYPRGDGSGYPADGSPDLTKNFVTSYAERAESDEDYAESFTAHVMLPTLPTCDTGACKKVRFMAEHGFADLRTAMRITEPDGSAAPIAPAPRAVFPFVITPPSWIHGTWQGVSPEDSSTVRFVFSGSDIVITVTPAGGGSVFTKRYSTLRDGGALATITPYDNSESAYGYHVRLANGDILDRTEYFYREGSGMRGELGDLGSIDFTRAP
jgi:hypothetical protein